MHADERGLQEMDARGKENYRRRIRIRLRFLLSSYGIGGTRNWHELQLCE